MVIAPFPWPGGKRTAALEVWKRFGSCENYVEPFAGSLAVLLARPLPFQGLETVNDLDGMVSNFWRSVRNDPDAVAHHADWPINENDLHARHYWLASRRKKLQDRLEGNPDFFDPKVAGWWCWCLCCLPFVGYFCTGRGSWGQTVQDGIKRLTYQPKSGKTAIVRHGIDLADTGRGVNKISKHQLVDRPDSLLPTNQGIRNWIKALAKRLTRVRVCCGDWSRMVEPTVTTRHGLTALFFDPPYSKEEDRAGLLYLVDDFQVSHQVRDWCLQNGDDPKLRIAFCGLDGETHHSLEEAGWFCLRRKPVSGLSNLHKGSKKINRLRECVWFSPHCLKRPQWEGFDLP
jgi:DNA adenine methylase